MKTDTLAPKGAATRPARTVASKTARPAREDFPIIGLGASAGGLEVFIKIFSELPAACGMAFVVIQHLDPTHESMMAALLSSHTSMKVCQAVDGASVECDHVYLIPPRVYLSIQNGLLHLSPPRERHGARMPIDFFLRSLADEYGERAVCAILSGTGSDGSLGVKAVKENGGTIIVQDPEEAAFDGMPRSAIDTGAADLILRSEKIPEALMDHARRRELTESNGTADAPPSSDEHLAGIIEFLCAMTSHNFTLYKPGTLRRRIERRMVTEGIADSERYMDVLRNDPLEIEKLAKDLLIHVTSFFRDPAAFKVLAATIIPNLVGQKSADQSLRIWMPACSTGEETYSLIMLLLEEIAAARRNIKLQVFATDIEEDSIVVARNGLYSKAIESEVTPDHLARFFLKEGDGYRISREMRESVIFTRQDILVDAPFSNIDLVSCRNLLIYFRPDVQEKVLSLFHFALRPAGILFLGAAEKIGSARAHFEPISEGHSIYRHLGQSRPGQVAFPISDGTRVPRAQFDRPAASSRTVLGDLSRNLLLAAYAPASVLINRNNEGLFFFGAVDNYLKIAPGNASGDILMMAREGLRNKLRTAIQQAAHAKAAVLVTGAKLAREGRIVTVTIEVRQVEGEAGPMYLVSFVDRPQPARGEKAVGRDDVAQTSHLEEELEATRKELEGAVRELELSYEKQKAVNEEAMSVNEEFQSANEELETSKEELQSLNEELTALNSQLHEMIEQQRTTANDLQNILDSADVAAIFLDGSLNIRIFTPAVKSFFSIIDADIGRPLADLATHFDAKTLFIDAATVLANQMPLNREVKSDKGVWYTKRMFPYRARNDRVGGVVITFADISERKEAEEKIEAERAYANSIVEAIRQPLVVLDQELRIVSASKVFYHTFGINREDAVGKPIGMAGFRHFDNPGLRSFFDRIQAGELNIEDYEIELDLPPAPDRRTLVMTAREIVTSSAKPIVLVAIDDITERKRLSNVLEVAKLHAEQANLGKSRFLAAASHDLRQPLQTLSLLRGILTKSVKDEDTLALVKKLDEPLKVMSGMLNTLLDINQLEAGTLKPEVVAFPIAALFERLKTEFGYHAMAKGLGWRIFASELEVRSDPQLLEQIIRNLLWNSIRYTSQGKILLGCRRRGNKLRIEVWDTGIGIPGEQLETIFEEFHQVENPARERERGLGLGLAIVRRIGNMLGHTIDVRSSLGKGSVFAIEVPLLGAAPGASAEQIAEGTAGTSNKIMIVEDDPMVRDMLELLFKAEGLRTICAIDGRMAQALITSGTSKPDIVIADYNLPGGLTGLETIANIRRALRREIPAIILTGDISTETLGKIARGHCTRLNKPANADELTELVSKLLAAEPQPASVVREPLPTIHENRPATVKAKRDLSLPTIFVVDDDPALCATMLELLALEGRPAESYPSCEAFLEAYQPSQKGCLLVDAQMRGMGGLALLERLKSEGSDLPAIMITGHGDVPMAVRAMKAGAVDFIEKPIDPDELIASIGGTLRRTQDAGKQPAWRAAAAKCIAALTPRERMVMDMVLGGHPSKNIAADLGISQRTVENHRASIMKKTGSKSIPALIRLALSAV